MTIWVVMESYKYDPGSTIVAAYTTEARAEEKVKELRGKRRPNIYYDTEPVDVDE